MPSPFPGMNPYIEQDAFRQVFHREFLPAMRGRLVARVRPKSIVMLDEHIHVQELPPEPSRLAGRADVPSSSPPRPHCHTPDGFSPRLKIDLSITASLQPVVTSEVSLGAGS
jgi:hypothetical protein